MNSLYVINSAGEKEPFSFQKVYRAARKVGASGELAAEIAKIIKRNAYDGIKTSQIFNVVKELLNKRLPQAALRFNLREAMKRLGPTGFPFEKFIGEIFKKLGFAVQINQHVPGFCLDDYEIDLIAQKKDLVYIGECKYKNLPGDKIHLQDALANYARFLDILKGPYCARREYRGCKIKTIMITNTKFTEKIIDYASCADVKLLGWKYPENNSLEYLIEHYKLYPVTILGGLRGYLREIFVAEKIMLVQDVLKINLEKFCKKFNVSQKAIYSLTEEAKLLLEE
jgi:hypothetical protein